MVASSKDIAVFWQDLISIYRDLLVVKTSKNAAEYLDLTDSEISALVPVAKMFTIEQMSYHGGMLEEAFLSMNKANAVKRIVAELTLVRMCDERLSSTPEAMLSRISALESRQFLAVSTEPEAATQNNTVPAETKPKRGAKKAKFDDDDEDFRSDGPTKIRQTASVESKSSKSEKSEQGGQNVRVLKPFRSRAEVLERMISTDPMTGSFFKNAKWYNDENGRIVFKFPTEFDITNMRVFDGEDVFIRIASQVTGRVLSKSDILCEVESQAGKDELIDQILEAAED